MSLRLTEWTSCGGCAAKWGASPLDGLVKTLDGMSKADAAQVLTPISFGSSNHVGERTMYQFTSSNKQLVSGGTMTITSAG